MRQLTVIKMELDAKTISGLSKGAGLLGDMKGDNLSFLRELTGLVKEINGLVSNPNISAMVKARQAQTIQPSKAVPTPAMQTMPVQRDPINQSALPAPQPKEQTKLPLDVKLPEPIYPAMNQMDLLAYLSTPEGMKALKTGLVVLQASVGDVTLSEVNKKLDAEIAKAENQKP
jgi:hypothetical protein